MTITLVEITVLTPLLPIILGIFNFNKLTKPLVIIYILIAITFCIDITAYNITVYFNMKNLWLFNLLIISQFILLFRFYFILLNSKPNKNVLLKVFALCLVFVLINWLFLQGPYDLNSYSLVLLSICVIVLSILYLKKIIKSKIKSNLYYLPEFWVISGLFIFYMGTFVISLFNNIVINLPIQNFIQIWSINNILSILFYVLTTIAIILCRKKHITSHN